MPSLQSLRRKIVAFKNTQKITKAMKMVTAAKLSGRRTRILAARPYAHKMDGATRNAGELIKKVTLYYNKTGNRRLRKS